MSEVVTNGECITSSQFVVKEVDLNANTVTFLYPGHDVFNADVLQAVVGQTLTNLEFHEVESFRGCSFYGFR